MRTLLSFSLPFWLISLVVPAAVAGERNVEVFLTQLPAVEETRAFEQYRSRPQSELSKMIYLIDRFGETNAEVIYAGKTFKTGMVARVARWFIKTHYNDEKAKGWINKWCYRTIPSGELVWVKGRDGSYFSARDILLADLGRLEVLTETINQGIPLAADLPNLSASAGAAVPNQPAQAIEFNLPLPQILAVATQN